MAKQQAHEKVVSILMEQIFSNRLVPGTKLPPERQLADEMDVDRTSLRVALKQLESMNVLDIRHGDGIYVKDYLKNAGIDFLRLLFSQPGADGKKSTIDEYLMDEIWEYWIAILPEMLKLAAKRVSPRNIKAMNSLIDKELECINDKGKIIEIEILEQELVAEVTNNTIFILLSNSSRPLRKKMVEIFINCIDNENLKDFIEAKKTLLNDMNGSSENVLAAAEKYRDILTSHHHMVRRSMFSK